MKRIFPLLLSFVLLLGGCAVQPVDDPAVPTAPAFSVKTDYSNYAPPEHYNPAFGGLGVTDLPAGEDYGLLYPFVGILYASDDSFVSSQRYYGFTDEKGKILVDPVYSSVEFLGDGEGGVWRLEKTGNTETDNYSYQASSYSIATKDGSRVTDCRYAGVSIADGLVLAEEMTENPDVYRYDIYDLQLNLLTTSEELLLNYPQIKQALYVISYAEGLFCLTVRTDTEYLVYYLNRDGSLLLGPYVDGYDFAYGCALVETEENGMYFINKEGKPLGGKYYTPDYYGDSFEDGVAVVTNQEHFWQDVLIDRGGNELLAASSAENLTIENGCIALNQQDVNITAYYSYEGELLYPEFHPFEETDNYAGFFPEEWEHLGDGVFYDENGDRLLDIANGKVYEDPFPHEYRPDNVYWIEELSCFIVEYYIGDSFEIHVYSAQLEKLIVLPEGWLNPYKDPLTGEMHLCFEPYDEGPLQIFDEDMKLCLEMPWDTGKHSYAIYNGRIMYQNEQGCMYFDLEGEQIFEYPFVSNDG